MEAKRCGRLSRFMGCELLTRLDFCVLYFIAGVVGFCYGIKKKNRLAVMLLTAWSIVAGLIILVGIALIHSID